MKSTLVTLFLGTALAVPASLYGQAYTEGIITIAGATAMPIPYGIDANDQMVGIYADATGTHGFLLSTGVLARIDQPLAAGTWTTAINNKAGIAGYLTTLTGAQAIRNVGSRYITLPNSSSKYIQGINASGTFVGYDANGKGFINKAGVYSYPVPAPCAVMARPNITIQAINTAGDYVGHCYDIQGVDNRGFANIGGVDREISAFGLTTYPTGINDSGTVVGYYVQGANETSGFLLTSSGGLSTFTYSNPSSTYILTQILGVNNKGSLVGQVYDAVLGRFVGFYALTN